jgi:hypothetical protein
MNGPVKSARHDALLPASYCSRPGASWRGVRLLEAPGFSRGEMSLGLSICILVLGTLATAVIVPAMRVQGASSASAGPSHKHPRVSQSVQNDVSPALRTIHGSPWKGDRAEADDFPQLATVRHGARNNLHAPVQTSIGPAAAPSTSANFDSVGNGFTRPQGTFTVNSAPPDTNGAVGPYDYVQTVNTDVAIFYKDSPAARLARCATVPWRSTRCGRASAASARPTTTAIPPSSTTASPIAGSSASSP